MLFLFIILISFFCPFVFAQEFNDDAQFLYFIDVLINFTVPFLIYVIVDYDTDENGSKTLAYIIRSLSFLINIGLQQELAFVTSPVKVSDYIKILQHIVIVLTGFIFIGSTIQFILNSKSNKKYKKEQISELDELKKRVNHKFENQLKYSKLENWLNYKLIEFEKVVHPKFGDFKKVVFPKFRNFKNGVFPKFDKFDDFLKNRIIPKSDKLKNEVKTKFDQLESEVKTKFYNLDNLGINSINSRCDKLETRLKEMTYPHPSPTIPEKQNVISRIYDDTQEGYELKMTSFIRYHNYEPSEPYDYEIYGHNEPYNVIGNYEQDVKLKHIGNYEVNIEHRPKLDKLLIITEYIALTLFIIVLGFLINDLKENTTESFIITLVIPGSLTLIIQFAYLMVSYHRGILQSYIKWYEKNNYLMPKNYVYIDLSVEFYIYITVLYIPSLINSFLLQTPDIFNKIFLNLSGMIVTSCILLMHKAIEREGERAKEIKKKKEKKEKEKEKEKEEREKEEGGKEKEEFVSVAFIKNIRKI